MTRRLSEWMLAAVLMREVWIVSDGVVAVGLVAGACGGRRQWLSERNVVMAGQGGVRAAARSAAAATRARLKAEQLERERLRDQLAEVVVIELASRDAAVTAYERKAGVALERLIGELGLSTADASRWCGDLPAREIGRMRQLARPTEGAEP